MNPLNAARMIERLAPWFREPDGSRCFYCDATLSDHRLRSEHRRSCPWLAMPKIIAALEAAERVRKVYGEVTIGNTYPLYQALEKLDEVLDA